MFGWLERGLALSSVFVPGEGVVTGQVPFSLGACIHLEMTDMSETLYQLPSEGWEDSLAQSDLPPHGNGSP